MPKFFIFGDLSYTRKNSISPKTMQLSYIWAALLLTTIHFVSYSVVNCGGVRSPPNISMLSYECGISIAAFDVTLKLFVVQALNKYIQSSALGFSPDITTPFYNVVRLGFGPFSIYRLFGKSACYAPRETMNSSEQCFECLWYLYSQLTGNLCADGMTRSAEILVADCFLAYTLDDETFCKPVPIPVHLK